MNIIEHRDIFSYIISFLDHIHYFYTWTSLNHTTRSHLPYLKYDHQVNLSHNKCSIYLTNVKTMYYNSSFLHIIKLHLNIEQEIIIDKFPEHLRQLKIIFNEVKLSNDYAYQLLNKIQFCQHLKRLRVDYIIKLNVQPHKIILPESLRVLKLEHKIKYSDQFYNCDDDTNLLFVIPSRIKRIILGQGFYILFEKDTYAHLKSLTLTKYQMKMPFDKMWNLKDLRIGMSMKDYLLNNIIPLTITKLHVNDYPFDDIPSYIKKLRIRDFDKRMLTWQLPSTLKYLRHEKLCIIPSFMNLNHLHTLKLKGIGYYEHLTYDLDLLPNVKVLHLPSCNLTHVEKSKIKILHVKHLSDLHAFPPRLVRLHVHVNQCHIHLIFPSSLKILKVNHDLYHVLSKQLVNDSQHLQYARIGIVRIV